jgi:hypothetical protein
MRMDHCETRQVARMRTVDRVESLSLADARLNTFMFTMK